jgi:dUTP pyrophosphatase
VLAIVRVARLSPYAFIPEKSTVFSSGYDLKFAEHEPLSLEPGDITAVDTGLIVKPRDPWNLYVRSRSGLAARNDIHVLNSSIPSDGSVKVILHNAGKRSHLIFYEDRIAQIVASVPYDIDWYTEDIEYIKYEILADAITKEEEGREVIDDIMVSRFRPWSVLPERVGPHSTTWYLKSCLTPPLFDPIIIHPGETAVIPTGLNVGIPKGSELQIKPVYNLALKGICVLNSPGTIDADYCGYGASFELKVILHNLGKHDYAVEHNSIIAEVAMFNVHEIFWEEVDGIPLKDSNRSGGIGSTGK